MKSLLLIISALFISGCANTNLKKEIVVKTEYIVRTAPNQLKKLPNYPEPIDLANADQTTLALWINNSEDYITQLEDMIANLIAFYEKPIILNDSSKKNSKLPTSTASGSLSTIIIEPSTNIYLDPNQRRLLSIK